jgi:hypothetical protein
MRAMAETEVGLRKSSGDTEIPKHQDNQNNSMD